MTDPLDPLRFRFQSRKPTNFELAMQKNPMSILRPLAVEQLGAGMIPSPVLFVKPTTKRATRTTTALELGKGNGTKGDQKDINTAIYTTECDYAYWYPSPAPTPAEAEFGTTHQPFAALKIFEQNGASTCVFRFNQPGSKNGEGKIAVSECREDYNRKCGSVEGLGEDDSRQHIEAGLRAINTLDKSRWSSNFIDNDRTRSFFFTRRGSPFASNGELECFTSNQFKSAKDRRNSGNPVLTNLMWDLVLGMWVPPGTSVTFECCRFPPEQKPGGPTSDYYFIDGKGKKHTLSDSILHRRKVNWQQHPDGVSPFTIRIDGGNQGVYINSTNDRGKWSAALGDLGPHNVEITGVSSSVARTLSPDNGGTGVGLLMSFAAGYWMTRDMLCLDTFDYQYGRELNPFLYNKSTTKGDGHTSQNKTGGLYPVSLIKSFRFDVTPVTFNKYESGLAWLMINNCFRDLVITDDDIPDDRQVVTVLGTELPTFQPQTSMCDHLVGRWCQFNLNRDACGCFKEESQARRYISSTEFSLPPQCFGKCADKSDSYQTREWSQTGCNEEICESVLDQHGQSILDSGQTEIVCDGRRHVIVSTPSSDTVPELNTATDDTSSNGSSVAPTTIVVAVLGALFFFLFLAWLILLIRRTS